MPRGKGAEKRAHAEALRALRLRREGYTTREIAQAIGCKPEQVKVIITLGERIEAKDVLKD